ncbi:hypothetical protein ACH3XW_34135 [Acanthocheilonema viteae]
MTSILIKKENIEHHDQHVHFVAHQNGPVVEHQQVESKIVSMILLHGCMWHVNFMIQFLRLHNRYPGHIVKVNGS